jgi:hypothetical protein
MLISYFIAVSRHYTNIKLLQQLNTCRYHCCIKDVSSHEQILRDAPKAFGV